MRPLSVKVNQDHPLCRMDVRVKMIAALILLAMVLSYKGFFFPIMVSITGAGVCIAMGVRIKPMLVRFSEPFFIVLVILVLKVFFAGNKMFFCFGIFGCTFTAHLDGLMEGLAIGSRIVGALAVVAVLSFSTPFNRFMAGLSWMRVPRGFIEVSLFAYRYIFMLLDDAYVIYNAQKNRLGYATIRRGLDSFGILSGSLVLKAFDHSQNIAVSMAQRGYDGNIPALRQKPFSIGEVLIALFVITVMGYVWKTL
ncbi:MAG TPA: cobalt ECF transporter T component CbiQ [Syntrophorhabdaceae bacterium]|nr:cobalt ECF transporter T component CbiQ [Syntrophorhabdaceae bacterium]